MLGFCTATGEIDLTTAPSLSADLHDTIDHSDVEVVVVDCTGLTFIDSAGFHALLEASVYAVEHDHTLVIRHLSPACAHPPARIEERASSGARGVKRRDGAADLAPADSVVATAAAELATTEKDTSIFRKVS